jgi:Alpha amylase, catalytic domain
MSIRRASPTLTATGIRDLPGITGRLSYLADLCVDAVWLSPRFASPMADFGYAVADHCSVDPVSARRRTSIHWSQRLLDGRLRVLIDFVGNESNEHELAALDGCPPRSDGTGVRLSAEEIAPTMPGTASARACSRRASAQSMRANGRAQSSVAPRALPLDRRASGSTRQGGLHSARLSDHQCR